MIEDMPYQLIGKDQVLPYIKEAMDIYAKELVKESYSLPPVSESKTFDIHNCINDVCDAVDAKIAYISPIRPRGNGSFRWRVKQAIDKMLYSR